MADPSAKQSILERLRLWWGRESLLRETEVQTFIGIQEQLLEGNKTGDRVIEKLEEIRSLLDDFNEQFYLATRQQQMKSGRNALSGPSLPKDPHPEEQPGIFMQSDAELAMLETLEGLKGRRGPEVTLDDPLDDEDLGLQEDNQ